METTAVALNAERETQASAPDRIDQKFSIGLARALGGAMIFALPMFMTMEMWQLGFYMDPLRLALFLTASVPLMVALSHVAGFEDTFRWKEDGVDAFVAYAVAFAAAAIVLLLFGVLTLETSADEAIGKVALQAVPGSIGALLAQSQFGPPSPEKTRRRETYAGEMFLMTAGALFLSLNVAPTEEMMLIAFKMTPWHALALAFFTLVAMHAFVYSVEFRGQAETPSGVPWWSLFLRYTTAGYAICLVISAYVLWTFERFDGLSGDLAVMTVLVLAFPAGLGAAAARLIL